ncbi:MAG TPA: AAA family ATPase, partial [Thermomicrobiaceae bacterium]|nr:AAA family ATPase [Thermomicrobiaceae bacterium]
DPVDAAEEVSREFPALVGRERERALLCAQLDAMLAGHGGLVLVGGEAGIGKTTLVEDLAIQAEEAGCLVLWGHAYDLTVTPPYGPWIEVVRRYQASGREPAFPGFLDDPEALAALGTQERLFTAVTAFFAAVASRQPQVVVLDDLHWADPGSLDLLRVLAREVRAQPILLVATYRGDDLTRRHPLAQLIPLFVREARAARLDLSPLGAPALRALIAGRYRLADPDAARLAAHLAARAGGNPFFITELLRTLEDAGVLSRHADTWLLGDLGVARVPPLLIQVIEGQLGRLADETRGLLEVAAIIGQEVPLDLWQHVGGATDAALAAAVEAGLNARLLEEVANGACYRFRHALLRDTLYQEVSALRRRAWHRSVGEVLAQGHAPDPDAVAHHFEQAGDIRAAAWLVRAGERAQLAYAWVTAVARYEAALRALEQAGADIRQQGWLRYRIARLRRYGTPQQSIAALDRALEVANAVPDVALAAAARYTRGLCRFFAGDLAAAVREMTAGVDALETLPSEEQARLDLGPDAEDEPVVTNPRGMLVTVLATAGHLQEALRMGEATREGHPRHTPLGELAWAHYGDRYVGLGMVYAWTGRPEEARYTFARARAMFQEIGNYSTLGTTSALELLNVLLPYQTDRLDEHRRQAWQAAAAWEQAASVDDRSAAGISLPLLRLSGDWGPARTVAERAWETGGRSPASQAAAVILADLAARQGEPELSGAITSALLPDGPRTLPGTVSLGVALPLQRLATELALETGDFATALDWLEAHDRWLTWSGAVLGRAEGALGWAMYHHAASDAVLARQNAEQALTRAAVPRQPLALIAVHRFLGILDTDDRYVPGAEEHLNESLALAEACAAPFERALTLLALAGLRIAQEKLDEAHPLLANVRSISEPLGARPTLERVASLEARLETTSGKSARPKYPAGLTAREVEVLRLVAEGLTDLQVAERLFVSPRTINTHLGSIYTKLNVNSRIAAARFAVEHDLV